MCGENPSKYPCLVISGLAFCQDINKLLCSPAHGTSIASNEEMSSLRKPAGLSWVLVEEAMTKRSENGNHA
jgi:hypothetical protein